MWNGMEQRRWPSPNWSSLLEEILLNILSRNNDDFLSRLAAMGVCREWRECSRWVDSLACHKYETRTRICNKHGKRVWQCGCICDSLSGIIGRSHRLRSLVLDEGRRSLPCRRHRWRQKHLGIWRLLEGCDWTRLCYSLEMLSVSTYCMADEGMDVGSSKLLHNISSCTRLSAFQLEFLDFDEYEWSFNMQVHVFERLKVLKLRHLFLTDSMLETLIGLCRSLEHLEIWDLDEIEYPMLNAPSLLILHLRAQFCSTVQVSAPRLRHLYLDGMVNFVTEGTSLRELTLASPITLRFTGMINLQKLSLVGRVWAMGTIPELFQTVPRIKCLHVVPVKFCISPPISVYDFFVGWKELAEVEVHVNFLRELSQAKALTNGKLGTIQFITIHLSGAKNEDSFECIADLLSLCPNVRRLALKGSSEDFRKWLKLHLEAAVDEKLSIHCDC